MDKIAMVLLMVLAGILLGVFFFGGLWWTTRRGLLSGSPATWFVGSLLIRMGVTLAVFYFISREHWERAIICLIGFIVTRIIIMRLINEQKVKQNQ